MASCIDTDPSTDMPRYARERENETKHDCRCRFCAVHMAGCCHICTYAYIYIFCAEGRHSSTNGAGQGSLEQESGQMRFEAVIEAVFVGTGLGLSEFKENI